MSSFSDCNKYTLVFAKKQQPKTVHIFSHLWPTSKPSKLLDHSRLSWHQQKVLLFCLLLLCRNWSVSRFIHDPWSCRGAAGCQALSRANVFSILEQKHFLICLQSRQAEVSIIHVFSFPVKKFKTEYIKHNSNWMCRFITLKKNIAKNKNLILYC